MKIKILKNYKGLTPFETPNLSDFVVLTGKNGSGKSQLLYLIHNKFTLTNTHVFKDIITRSIEIEGYSSNKVQSTNFGEIHVHISNPNRTIDDLQKALPYFIKNILLSNIN